MSELNKPLQPKCTDCGDTLSPEVVEHGFDEFTRDHTGLCCDCFDVSLGMKPPVKLELKAVASLYTDEEYD